MADELAELDRDDSLFDFTEHVPADLDGFPIDEAVTFLDRLAQDWGENEAGLARPLCWSPAKGRRFLKIDGISELVWAIHEMENESVERATLRTARSGNPAAQKLWLFNRAAHRGWADRRTVSVEGEIDHNVVVSVREALEAQTRQLTESSGTDGVAAPQAAMGLGVDEDSIDAEVVDR